MNLFKINREKIEKSFLSMVEWTQNSVKKLERLPKKATTLLSLQVMGLSVQALIYGTCITLFLLVLVSLG